MDNKHISGGVHIRHGRDFQLRGENKKAIEYLKKQLKIEKEICDWRGEGRAYGNLGNA